ncbi:hypothetical protein FGW37_08255 [Streptomyces rectiverticillatus]|nr:hypothetical protein FGW37_08255 [Streptomyces rectiverticillatus]
MPELAATSPFCPLPAPRPLPRLVGVGVVVLSLACMGVMVRQAEKAAGLVAGKGTLTVERCEQRREGGHGRGASRSHTLCSGTFRADSGRVVRDSAALRGWYVTGEKVRVYREGYGYRPVGLRYFWGGLAFFFVGLAGVAAGVMTTVVGYRVRTLGESRAAWAVLRRTSVAPYVAWLFRAAGAGTAVCVLLLLVSP